MRRLTTHERINLRSWLAPVLALRCQLVRLPLKDMLRTAYAVTGHPLSEVVKRPRPALKRK